MNSEEKTYVKRLWLNKDTSPSLGYVAAYHGKSCWANGIETSLSIADCNKNINLHKTDLDTNEDFINKLILLRDFIDDYIVFLKDINKVDLQSLELDDWEVPHAYTQL